MLERWMGGKGSHSGERIWVIREIVSSTLCWVRDLGWRLLVE
jgi:hypothetical protein